MINVLVKYEIFTFNGIKYFPFEGNRVKSTNNQQTIGELFFSLFFKDIHSAVRVCMHMHMHTDVHI